MTLTRESLTAADSGRKVIYEGPRLTKARGTLVGLGEGSFVRIRFRGADTDLSVGIANVRWADATASLPATQETEAA